MKSYCQNLNWDSAQAVGEGYFAGNFVNHLVLLFEHGLHQTSHIPGLLLRWPPPGTIPVTCLVHAASSNTPHAAFSSTPHAASSNAPHAASSITSCCILQHTSCCILPHTSCCFLQHQILALLTRQPSSHSKKHIGASCSFSRQASATVTRLSHTSTHIHTHKHTTHWRTHTHTLTYSLLLHTLCISFTMFVHTHAVSRTQLYKSHTDVLLPTPHAKMAHNFWVPRAGNLLPMAMVPSKWQRGSKAALPQFTCAAAAGEFGSAVFLCAVCQCASVCHNMMRCCGSGDWFWEWFYFWQCYYPFDPCLIFCADVG